MVVPRRRAPNRGRNPQEFTRPSRGRRDGQLPRRYSHHPRAGADGGAQEADRGKPPGAAQIHRQGASDPFAAIIDCGTYTGKRCKFGMTVSLWHKDEGNGGRCGNISPPPTGQGPTGALSGRYGGFQTPWSVSSNARGRQRRASAASDARTGQTNRRRDGVGAAHAGGQAGAVDPVPERQRGADMADRFRRRRGQDGVRGYGVPARWPPLSLGTLTLIGVKAHSRPRQGLLRP